MILFFRALTLGFVAFIATIITFPVPAAAISYDSLAMPWREYVQAGNRQYYHATFRGNGEAIVEAKLLIENGASTPLAQYTIDTGMVSFTDKPIFVQEIAEGRAYSVLPMEQKGSVYTLTLSESIGAGKQGSILVRFRSFSYTSPSFFGRRTAMFKTFGVGEEVDSVQVSLSADMPLYMSSGSNLGINYKNAYPANELGYTTAIGLSARPSVIGGIGGNATSGGTVTKTASNLAPHETFTVKTIYATTKIGLRWHVVAWGLIAALALLGLIVFLLSRPRRPIPPTPPGSALPQQGGLFHPYKNIQSLYTILFSFGNAAILAGILFLAVHGSSSFWMDSPFAAITYIFSVGAFLLGFLVAPSIFWGFYRGRRQGILAGIFLFIWIIGGLALLWLSLYYQGDSRYYGGYFY